ncbi:hypothetical protein H0178_28700 [Cytobacillus firmus]|uniref:hypothetical protein n=1 Tax=Paenibacillus lautus TaxID=1401 RepID=UPI00384C2C69|nr:hypothetical protein [Cytobacillus firmus]
MKRFSVQKSEWSDKREEDYKKECFNIVYEFGHKLNVEDDRVFLMMSEMNIEILKPLKFGSFWYETWLEIRKNYKID